MQFHLRRSCVVLDFKARFSRLRARGLGAFEIRTTPQVTAIRLRWVQIMLGLVVAYYLITSVAYGLQIAAYVHMLAIVAWCVAEYLRVYAKKIELACWLVISTAVLVVGATAMVDGQSQSDALWFFPVVPLMAGQLLGNRAMLITAVASFLGAGVVLVSERFFLLQPEYPDSFADLVILRLVALAVCSGVSISAKRSFQSQARELDRRARQLNRARIERDEARRSASVFLANMSEHVRAPMAELVLQTQDIQKAVSNQHLHLAQDAEKCARGVRRLLQDILDLSDLENERLELNQTKFLVSEFEEDLRAWLRSQPETSIHVSIDGPKEGLWVTLDRTRLHQICTRLMENALMFSQANTLTVSLQISADAQGPTDLVIRVSDDGIGITSSCRAQVMERFAFYCDTQADQDRGAGISLVLIRQLARSMGGDVSFEDQLDGTSIRVQVRAEASTAMPEFVSKDLAA